MSRFLLVLLLLGASNYVSADDSDTTTTETPVKLQCQPNEYQDDCPSDCASDGCPKAPPTVESTSKSCKIPTNKANCPPPACRCKVNYRRAENGTCIDVRKCPAFDCSQKPNEEYVACPIPVCSDSCSRATADGKCHTFGRIGVLLICSPQCRCIKNYWRKDGICVPYAECGKEQTVTVDSTGVVPSKSVKTCNDEDTASSNTSIVKQPESTTKTNDENASTPTSPAVELSKPETSSEGTPKMKCPANEVLDECPSDCEPEYCAKTREEAQPKSCVSPADKAQCPPPKCKCGFNQRRAANGTCISVYDCPAFECNGLNEKYVACPSYCPGESCEAATKDGNCSPLFVSLIVVRCQQSCRCIKNYWRKDGVCVPYAECGKGNQTEPVIVKPYEGRTPTFIQTDNNDDTRGKEETSVAAH